MWGFGRLRLCTHTHRQTFMIRLASPRRIVNFADIQVSKCPCGWFHVIPGVKRSGCSSGNYSTDTDGLELMRTYSCTCCNVQSSIILNVDDYFLKVLFVFFLKKNKLWACYRDIIVLSDFDFVIFPLYLFFRVLYQPNAFGFDVISSYHRVFKSMSWIFEYSKHTKMYLHE